MRHSGHCFKADGLVKCCTRKMLQNIRYCVIYKIKQIKQIEPSPRAITFPNIASHIALTTVQYRYSIVVYLNGICTQ